MANLNIHVDIDILNKFKELKFLLKTNTNEETQEKIIELAYKDLKKEETK